STNRIAGIAVATALLLGGASLAGLSQGKGVLTQKEVSLDMARAMADASIAKCRSENYHVSVHILDSDGQPITSFRDDGSSEVNYDVSRRKAYTALMYRRPSSEMEKAWATMSPARIIPGTFGVGGGLPIKIGNDTIGAIGVGGAPGSDKDEACAAAGNRKAADENK